MNTATAALAAILATSAIAAPASAAESAARTAKPASSGLHLDLETDPTAFVFRGYSLHAGVGYDHLRLDVGAYAMDLPGFMESNKGFESSFRGAGAKLQLFLFDEQKGGFVGIDSGISHLRVDLAGTDHHASQNQVSTGVNLGWRFALPYGLYATPWLGISYSFGANEMTVDGNGYHPNAVTFFPAVHVGYRFL